MIIFEEHIRLNSFKGKIRKKRESLNVPYEDMVSIKSRKLPLTGLWGIKICANNIPCDITLSFSFLKRKQKYKEVCDVIKKNNPDVVFDSYLQQYLEG